MAEEKKNPLEKIVEFYEKSVEDSDKENPDQPKKFKKAAEFFIKKMLVEGFHIVEEKYLDGYFIMGTGTNSVFHFHVKECPNWLFGIWWNISEYDENHIEADCFAQHEDWIDKFKPTASSLCTSLSISFREGMESDDEDTYADIWETIDMFNFIKKYPYRAFQAHMTYLNQFKPISGFAAFKFRIHFILEQKKEKRNREKMLKKVTRWVNKNFSDFCKKYEGTSFIIHDQGEHISPKFIPVVFYPPRVGETAGFEEDVEQLKDRYTKACRHIENKCRSDSRGFSYWIDFYEGEREENV